MELRETFINIGQACWQTAPHCHFYPMGPGGVSLEERRKLRTTLVEHLEQHTDLGEDRTKLLTPGTSPQSKRAAISISHCGRWGGFIFSFEPHLSIGLDIEQATRVKEGLVGYISTAQERNEAPGEALLWVAKEAAFKCVPAVYGPLMLGNVAIGDWRPLTGKAWRFGFLAKSVQGEGVAFVWEQEDLALATTRAKT